MNTGDDVADDRGLAEPGQDEPAQQRRDRYDGDIR